MGNEKGKNAGQTNEVEIKGEENEGKLIWRGIKENENKVNHERWTKKEKKSETK